MSMASLPMWLEGILNRKYPQWRNVEYNADGSARYMPAGVRVLEASLLRHYPAEDIACCYPADLDKFIGPDTRIVAVSTHNPLGVTFAAGVYTSIFGSSKQPINSHYSLELFEAIKANPHRKGFKVIVGGSGGWQITQTNSWDALSVDCVVEGRSESADVLALFDRALAGEDLPKQMDVSHPKDRNEILFPDKRTTFGVVEMTTGCGRRASSACRISIRRSICPRTRSWRPSAPTCATATSRSRWPPKTCSSGARCTRRRRSTFPNREALVDLYRDIVNTPGVEQHVLSHSTIAPAVVDPVMIKQISDVCLDKSPIHLPYLSTHPKNKALVPLVGLETGSVRMAKQIMPSKGVPFPIDEWPSVVVRGLEVLNENNWFPAMTLIIGSPGETDEDVKATIDLIYEVERRGLFAFFIPSIFTPLHDTRMEVQKGVAETSELTPLQWQLMMKCWKMNLRPGQASWWAPTAWRLGAIGLWAWKLRKLNGPGFTWPMFMFANALPGVADGQDGQDPRGPAAEHQDAEGTAGHHQAAPASVPAAGHRRYPRRSGPAPPRPSDQFISLVAHPA